MKYQKLEKTLQQYSGVYFYGAGVVAFGAYKAIQKLYGITVKGFLVTEEEKLNRIEGLPVYVIDKAGINRTENLIMIAAPEEYHHAMEEKLKELGFLYYIKIDSELEYRLMGSYLKQVMNLHLVEDFQAERNVDIDKICRIYMAISHGDRKLQETYREKPWIRKVQAGAALTNERIAKLTDEGKGSLSAENPLYGELTVSHYIWKHNSYAVTGLFHYRRVLDVTEEQLALLADGTADIILPLPFVCSPDASGQYGRYLLPGDIEIMREVLKEKEPEYFEETEAILRLPYLYNYNMLVAGKNIFDGYCAWLFPLLEEITRRCEEITRNRRARYIGRIGEVLTSIYFMRNEKRLCILHAKKIWRI